METQRSKPMSSGDLPRMHSQRKDNTKSEIVAYAAILREKGSGRKLPPVPQKCGCLEQEGVNLFSTQVTDGMWSIGVYLERLRNMSTSERQIPFITPAAIEAGLCA